jgi:alpha-L-fucosidase 2
MSYVSNKLKKGWEPLPSLSVIVSSSLIACSETANPSTHAFNTGTGALNVDYAAYLSKHDVVFNSPVTDTKSGLTVGNGRVGQWCGIPPAG